MREDTHVRGTRIASFVAGALGVLTILGCPKAPPPEADPLTVVSTSPADGATEVLRDQDVRVVFSHDLDPEQPEDLLVVLDDADRRIEGQTLVNGNTIVFVPTRFDANARLTVTLAGDVRSAVGSLEQPLGFSFTTGAAASGKSNIPPDGYDPMGSRKLTALGRIPEVALVGCDTHYTDEGFARSVALEDPPYNPAPLTNGVTASSVALQQYASLGTYKRPVAGNFDDDPWEETAVFSFSPPDGELRLTVVDPTASEVVVEVETGLSFGSVDRVDARPVADFLVLDFDGDGLDEVIFATAERARTPNTIDWFLVGYDTAAQVYVVEAEGSLLPNASDPIHAIHLGAGDVDVDGRPELVLAWSQDTGDAKTTGGLTGTAGYAMFAALDDFGSGMTPLSAEAPITYNMMVPDAGCPSDAVDVAVGDVDGDGVAETLVGLTRFYLDGERCEALDSLFVAQNAAPDAEDAQLDLQLVNSFAHSLTGSIRSKPAEAVRWFLPVLELADIDGDLRQELLFHRNLFLFPKLDDPASRERPVPRHHRLPDDRVQMDDFSSPLGGLSPTVDVRVGDLDGDLKDDFVFLRRNIGGFTSDGAGGTSAQDDLWIEHFDVADCTVEGAEDYCAGFDPANEEAIHLAWKRFDLQLEDVYSNFRHAPALALPNVDDDSMVVERVGHTVATADNVIVAILAAPPCSADLGQDTGNCATELGNGTTESWEDGFYATTSFGLTIGFESEPGVNIPLTPIKVKFAKTEGQAGGGVETSFQHNWGGENTEMITFSAGADNNLIIFDTNTYDRYRYRILTSPDPALQDTCFNVSIPTGHKRLAVSQAYYNANNGEQLDIDDAILPVVPGALDTYPSRAEALATLGQEGHELIALSDVAVQVPQGPSNAVTIEEGTSQTASDEWSVGGYVSVEGKLCTPTVNGSPTICGGFESTTTAGYVGSHTWSWDTVFAGTVTGIPAERYASDRFGAGLFAYQRTATDPNSGATQFFKVVSYFVER